MKICRKVQEVKKQDYYISVLTDAAEIRLMFLTDDILRIRAGFEGDFAEESYSLALTGWDDRLDDVLGGYRKRTECKDMTLEDGPDQAVIRGKKLTVTVEKDPFRFVVTDPDGTVIHADITDLAFQKDSNGRVIHTSEISQSDSFYGFGEKGGEINKAQKYLNMSPSDAMGYDPIETDSLYKHIPFYIKLNAETKKAVGYFYHNTRESDFNMGRSRSNYWKLHSTYRADGGDIDLFLIHGPQIREIVERYTDLTGKSAMLPISALGYLGSSMFYSELPKDSDDAICNFVDMNREEGIPIDGFQLSSGYCAVETSEGQKRCSFTWNHERFKDPADFFGKMKEKGVVVTPNIKPGMLLVHPLMEEMKQQEMFVKQADSDEPEIGTWWGGPGAFVDFTKPQTRVYWKKLIKENLLKYGVESIWDDNCEYDSIVDKDGRCDFDGKGCTIGQLKSVMANIMCQLANEAVLEYYENVRPFIVCRAGHAGIQRYAQTWAGDNYTSWDTLKYNIATMLGMSLSGVANQGCDVGGFFGPAPDEELFVRWVQNGIFMPRFSIHSQNTDNTVTEPWMYSGSKDLIRSAIEFRYQLSPYLYSLMRRAHVSGLPIMEPLFCAFQNDPKTYQEGVDFMFGDSLLVANVVEKGAQTRKIYLPEGADFYDFYDRIRYTGGQEIEVPVTIESIPLFLRSGAILPMSEDKLTNLKTQHSSALRILMVPDVDSEFALYEDDGSTNDYLKGQYLETKISVKAKEQTEISFSRTGEYQTKVQSITLDVVRRENAPNAITLNGEEIPRILLRGKYEEADYGWYYSQRLRSVQIKYPNPAGDYTVVMK